MKDNALYIKNMVCPRCIETVSNLLSELEIPAQQVSLGEVITRAPLSEEQKRNFGKRLEGKGFELLQDDRSKLISRIKSIVIDVIHHEESGRNINFSSLLSEKLHHEYTSLSRLFSSVEGITLEKYILKQKIEKVKELIFYNEQTLSEIAFDLGYSSVAHLSSQFKKETGMTPSEFKKMRKPGHQALDQL